MWGKRVNYINTTAEDEQCECGALIFPATLHSCIPFPTNDYELVIECSKNLERVLRVRDGAKGRTLAALLDSLRQDLDPRRVTAIEYVIAMRNKLVHEVSSRALPDRRLYIHYYELALCDDDGY